MVTIPLLFLIAMVMAYAALTVTVAIAFHSVKQYLPVVQASKAQTLRRLV